jgi:hypothetical protein
MNNYKFSIPKETITSRLPSLFPYVEFNSYGISEVHSAFDSVNGSYGKIVPNLMLPNSDKSVPYFILMEKYYNDEVTDEEKSFIETAIGKITVDKSQFDDKKNDLVPDFVYLATVKGLYFEYSKMSKQCLLYDKLLEEDKNNYSAKMCCLCEKYNRMGGDKMLGILESLLEEAEAIANQYMQYADNSNDSGLSTKICIPLMQSIEDLGILDCEVEEWVAGKEYRKDDRVMYSDEVYICKVESTNGYYNEETEEIEFDIKNWKIYKSEETGTYELNGYSDSKLTSLRRYTEYLDENDETDSPEEGEDWLFFYRKGYVANYRTINDIYGNITHVGNDYTNGNDLYAYGDVLIDIVSNKDEQSITFTYCLDAHLKAEYATTKTDDDGNEKYYYTNFQMDEINEDNHHGVVYEETYYYDEDSDLDNLIKKGWFEKYINSNIGENDITNYTEDGFTLFTKFEFNTASSSTIYTKDIGTEQAVISTVMSSFNTKPSYDDLSDSLQDTYLYKRDYFNGISYLPTKNIDVHVNRGSTAAFETNIKLGEIHTMEDLENYSNGGYFQMRSVTDES